MTNENIRWSAEPRRGTGGKELPFLLKPAVKNYLWGGRRLRDEFSKESVLSPLAETWECSTHPNGPSAAASGRFAGTTLTEIIRTHPEFLGEHPKSGGELPLLVKLIDAKRDLSIQVHPNDAYAAAHENGQRGKSEMWYVLDAEPGAELVYGLKHDMTREAMRQSIQDGSVERHVRRIPVQRDDVFYVEAGTIHAIGGGVLVAEIQENSDLTYRLYDYRRIDRDGKPRELHEEKALEAANLRGEEAPRQAPRVLRYRQGYASELLCRCRYFEARRILINTERCHSLARYRADSLSFRVLLCLQGCGALLTESGEPLLFFKGDCIFFPADSEEVRLHGRAQFLDVRG